MMATRIESGQMQVRSVGSAPIVQVQQQQIDYVGPRAEAQGAGALAQMLDRMSANAFSTAVEMVKDEGLQYVIDNPPSSEQLEAAKNGDPTTLIPKGNFSYFDKAVRKARSYELASEFNIEMSNIASTIAVEVQQGTLNAEQARNKLNSAQVGMSASLAKIDAEAALKFRATSAMHGNTVINEAYKVQLQKEKAKNLIKLEQYYANEKSHLQMVISEGSWKDATGQDRTIDQKIEVIAKVISDAAISVGDAGVQQKYSERFAADIKQTKIDVGTKLVLSEEFMANPNVGTERILKGDLGRFSPVWQGMDEESKKAIRDNFNSAVTARRSGVENTLFAAQQTGDGILRKIYMANTVPEMNALFKQLDGLPVQPSVISAARTFIKGISTAGREKDDLAAFGTITGRIAAGLATPKEILDGPFTQETKKELIRKQADPSNPIHKAVTAINSAVNIQQAGMPPEFSDARARELANLVGNDLKQQLYDFSRTLDANDRLPDNVAIIKKGEDLAIKAKASMSTAFADVANTNKNSAVLMIPELQGVDLNNDAAVDAAIAKATARKANPNSVTSARNSIDNYRKNTAKVQGQK
jgi:hypothetical protein